MTAHAPRMARRALRAVLRIALIGVLLVVAAGLPAARADVPATDRLFVGTVQSHPIGNLGAPRAAGNPWPDVHRVDTSDIQVVADPNGVTIPTGEARKVVRMAVDNTDELFGITTTVRAQLLTPRGLFGLGTHFFKGISVYVPPEFVAATDDSFMNIGEIYGAPESGQGPLPMFLKRSPADTTSPPGTVPLIVRWSRSAQADRPFEIPVTRGTWNYIVWDIAMSTAYNGTAPNGGKVSVWRSVDGAPYQPILTDFVTNTVNAGFQGASNTYDKISLYREKRGWPDGTDVVLYHGPHLLGKTFDAADPLQAYGAPPATAASLTATPATAAFGDVQAGTHKDLTVSVKNTGGTDATVAAPALTGTNATQFTVPQGGFTLAPGATRDLVIGFDPADAGAKTATLALDYGGAAPPLTIQLSGNGTAAAPPADQTPPPAPDITPAAGAVPSGQEVAMSDAEAGATIRYTVGTGATAPDDPAAGTGTLYSGPFAITADQVIKAAAFDAAGNRSAITQRAYTVATPPPAPDVTPPSGAVPSGQQVVMSSSLAGGTIRYTVGTGATVPADPAANTGTVYSGPFTITSPQVIKAAVFDAAGHVSAITQRAYTISAPPPAPAVTPPSGAVPSGQQVVMSSSQAGAAIRYTVGTGSTVPADPTTTNGTAYSGPFTITAAQVIKAAAFDVDGNRGPITQRSYTIAAPAGGTRTLTLTPDADAIVRQARATSAFGAANPLIADSRELSTANSAVQAFLRFTVPALQTGETITGARLSVLVTDTTGNGPAIWRTGANWSEGSLTWNTRPGRIGTAAVGNFGAMNSRTRTSTAVSGVTVAGAASFQLAPESNDALAFSSREAAAASRPQLILTVRTP